MVAAESSFRRPELPNSSLQAGDQPPLAFAKEKFMKAMTFILALFGLGVFIIQSGCSTDQPGTTDTLGSYTTNVDSSPDKVTTAAYKACEDLKLSNINSGSGGSKVDGEVTATTAQGENVTIDIKQNGDNVSKVTIRVGATGDNAVSEQLIDRIKAHLSWF
jgi:hypothetical protein